MNSIRNVMNRIIDILIIILIAIITVLILCQILFRFIDIQAIWINEFVRFLFVYLVFLGSALAISQKGHIVINTLVERFPRKLRMTVFLLVQVFIITFLIFFIQGVVGLIGTVGGSAATSMRWFNMSYLYYGVLGGAVLMIFYTICEILDAFMKKFYSREGGT